MPIILALPVLLAVGWLIPGRPRRAVRWVTLFLMCVVLLPCLILVDTAGWTARAMLLEPSFHISMLKKVNMYSAAAAFLGEAASSELLKKPDLKASERDAIAQVIRAAMSEIVSPAWIEEEVNRLLTGSLKFLKEGGPAPELGISLRERKAMAIEYLTTQKIPAPFLAEIKKAISNLPDGVPPSRLQAEQAVMAMSRIRPQVQAIMLAGPAGALATMLLVLLAWLVAGRGRGIAAWLGAGFLAGGIGVTALGMTGRVSLLGMTSGFQLSPPFNALPLQAWVEATVFKILATWQIAGSGIAFAGVLLLVIPFMAKRTPSGGEALRG
ncbi:MAG: hypothetical protein HPY55_12055 [Firmicutes bacterium]|nr:hypothetical protein [Bacillota bacterium]